MEKQKNLYVQPMDMNCGEEMLESEEGVAGRVGRKGRKNWDNCNIIIKKIYLKKWTHNEEKQSINQNHPELTQILE